MKPGVRLAVIQAALHKDGRLIQIDGPVKLLLHSVVVDNLDPLSHGTRQKVLIRNIDADPVACRPAQHRIDRIYLEWTPRGPI